MRKKQYEDDYEDEYYEPRKRSKAPILLLLLLIVAIGAIAIYIYLSEKSSRQYTSWEWLSHEEMQTQVKYLRGKGSYAAFDRDGAFGYNCEGGQIWNIGYNLKSPIGDTCGSYYVFADRGGAQAFLTDGTGTNTEINVKGRISEVKIADNGTVAFLTDNGLSDDIYLYNAAGELLLEVETSVKKSGFPVTIALSPDGRKLVTSYVKVGTEKENRLTFYNFSDVGQSYADRIVGSYSYGDEIIADIKFAGKDRVCVFTKDSCSLYKFKEIPEKLKTEDFEGGLIGAAVSDKLIAIVSGQKDGMRGIDIYDTDGNSQSTVLTGMTFDRVLAEEDEIEIISNASYIIVRADGSEKSRAKLDEGISLMVKASEDTYAVASERYRGEIRLRTKKEDMVNE